MKQRKLLLCNLYVNFILFSHIPKYTYLHIHGNKNKLSNLIQYKTQVETNSRREL